MKLDNTFTIPAPATQAWPVLLDLERIAPCVPGATITSRDGDDFHGKIKVKLGPVGLSYNGIIKVVSQDEQAGIAVLEGRGRETRGNGTAKATITCKLVENDGSTEVFVDTDLSITGKPAQFGRGALADVAGTLIGQFAANLADEITSTVVDGTAEPANTVDGTMRSASLTGAGESALPSASAAAAPIAERLHVASTSRAPAEPLDLLAAAGRGNAARYGAIAAALAGVLLLTLVQGHRSARARRSRQADK
ncbi:SRPBCC family protein [Nocardia vermiculata]|uniref:SRPBCC family protein n=1 Tax=Nocardia vermiculata TaxID=257274 RepID=A0A846Y256_9NOCA|nr:SRPBCC family protein [Nocardia vermiculata]NKY51984.1 SRPBCC family protein [Nocardia vermiculata]